jgi:hypothetical protein
MRPESVRNPRRYFGDNHTGAVVIFRDGNASVPFESMLERDWLILGRFREERKPAQVRGDHPLCGTWRARLAS